MEIKKFFDLYDITNKVGLCNENKRLCLCGTELSESDKTCPNCNIAIKKTALLNVNKNNALGKRYETVENGNTFAFKYYQLLSNGFELYESEVFEFFVNKTTSEVKITNSKIFKTIDSNSSFNEFLDKHFAGYKDFVYKCLGEFRYEMAISNFGSLDGDKLTNFMNVYLNYKALIPFIRGYKVLYYGNKFNLKKYYPRTDFNNFEEVKTTKLNLALLLSWDIKNEKYIESIIEISNTYPQDVQVILGDILHNMLSDRRSNETFDNTIKTFSLLYNKEISIEDFIRIYNNSRDNYFNELYEYRKLHKKLVSKTIDWTKVDKIDRKTIGMLRTKEYLKADVKLPAKEIDIVYDLMESDPLKALTYFNENNIKAR